MGTIQCRICKDDCYCSTASYNILQSESKTCCVPGCDRESVRRVVNQRTGFHVRVCDRHKWRRWLEETSILLFG